MEIPRRPQNFPPGGRPVHSFVISLKTRTFLADKIILVSFLLQTPPRSTTPVQSTSASCSVTSALRASPTTASSRASISWPWPGSAQTSGGQECPSWTWTRIRWKRAWARRLSCQDISCVEFQNLAIVKLFQKANGRKFPETVRK